MTAALSRMDPWQVVLLTGLFTQFFKLALYCAANRRLSLRALVATNGLPSTYAVTFSTLTTLVGADRGVDSPVFVVSFVFSAIVLHDVIRVRASVDRGGRTALLVAEHLDWDDHVEGVEGGWEHRLRPFLGDRGHRPLHVAVGIALGVVAGLAWSPL